LWAGLGTLPVIVAAVLVIPVVVDPLFNKFTPLRDQHLKTRILDLAARAHVPARRVFEVDMSTKTRKVNAYVTGFGASQRIVLWDTTLRDMTEDEILFVMGHEMGHYSLGHIWKGILAGTALAFVLLFIGARLITWAIRRWGERWGFDELSDVASMPLFAVTLTVLSFVVAPAENAFTRAIEHEADVYGLEITRDNDAASRAFLKLAAGNRSNPEPASFVRIMLYDHPPLVERIEFALAYRPWKHGEPNRAFRPEP
jgi:STE24 endopeptidase